VCRSYILNLVVNEGFKALSNCVSNIRNAVKVVRSSLQRMTKFKECIKCEKIQRTKTVSLDVQMFSATEKYQKVLLDLGRKMVILLLFLAILRGKMLGNL
jgi:hypothetical protein